MKPRRRAREVALQVLFQDDLNPRSNPATGDVLIARRLGKEDLVDFARGLVAGVRRNRQELDQCIERAAVNWTLGRMAATDRNVLRMGAYEILHTETPPPVVVNEAVELAKRFGTSQSASFVNGILDRLMHVKQDAPSETEPRDSSPRKQTQ
jgi:N utilization substance protein B